MKTDQEKSFSARPVPPPVVENDDFPEELWDRTPPAESAKKEEAPEKHPVPEYLKS